MTVETVLPTRTAGRGGRAVPPALLVFALLAVVPLVSAWIGTSYYLTLFSRIMILGMAAIGLNLILGFGGLVSLGHALYIGLGAYAVGILSRYGILGLGTHLAVMAVVVVPVACGIGWVSLRTRGLGFIMITMAFGQMFYYLAVSLKIYGGDEGLVIQARSLIAEHNLLDTPVAFYGLVLVLLAATALIVHTLTRSPFGLVLSGARQSEQRMRTLGYPLLRYRLAAYIVSAVIAGLAGCLLADLTLFASPEYMSWTQSGTLVAMIVLGGLGTTVGPLVGAIVLLLLEEVLSSWTDHWLVIVGPAIVAIVLFASRGLYGRAVWRAQERAVSATASDITATAGDALRIECLSKSYGALVVTDDVSLSVAPKSVHALIGPNGAGKSTLIGQLTGELLPDAGHILLFGQDITPIPPEDRARRGLSRSYQISAVLPEFTLLQNVVLAQRARRAHILDMWPGLLRDPLLVARCRDALHEVGLADLATASVAHLSYGQKRQLELAMAISQEPRVLLLDEPLAGMGPRESEQITALIGRLRGHYAILLVEHDMPAVFALATTVTVLVRGQVIASGSPDAIRDDPAVRSAYLGDEEIAS